MALITTMNLNKTCPYAGFRKLGDDLLAKGKATSGNDSDVPLTELTKVNSMKTRK